MRNVVNTQYGNQNLKTKTLYQLIYLEYLRSKEVKLLFCWYILILSSIVHCQAPRCSNLGQRHPPDKSLSSTEIEEMVSQIRIRCIEIYLLVGLSTFRTTEAGSINHYPCDKCQGNQLSCSLIRAKKVTCFINECSYTVTQ